MLLTSMLVYLGASGYAGTFSPKLAIRFFILPGMSLSIGTYYMRNHYHKEFEGQLKEIYKQEFKKYEDFFLDTHGYEDDWINNFMVGNL